MIALHILRLSVDNPSSGHIFLWGNCKISVETWQIYVLIGIILAILEIFVPSFILLPIGVGFLATAPVAVFVPSLIVQFICLAINISFCLFVFRKLFVRDQDKGSIKTNADNLVGQTGMVEEPIDGDQSLGYVKIYGDSWKAFTNPGVKIDQGTKVTVVKLDGNKIGVEPTS